MINNIKELIVLYDGSCNLCHWSVNFIKRTIKRDQIKFVPLHSTYSQKLLPEHYKKIVYTDSVIFIDNNRIYQKSSALLRLLKYLKYPWPFLRIFFVIPRFIRDYFYDWVASHRKLWFGENKSCTFSPHKNYE
jgi:predicted DCC family thiol-disulfide oxidoreductase YuxK